MISQTELFCIIFVFATIVAVAVRIFNRKEMHPEGFLAADRNLPVWQGAVSIAVSWVWAPAIFVCSMQAYKMGLPGIFWFTLPNVLCFFVFVPLAIRMRKLLPAGYTLPEFIAQRFSGVKSAHLAFLFIFFGYQLAAVISNTVAGGFLIHELAGLEVRVAVLIMMGIALSYCLWSGLKASVLTDIIQMAMVLGLAFVLVPWCIAESGGIATILKGLGGVDGNHRSVLDPWIAFSMGIPMTITLLAGPLCDQMFFQRAAAVRRENIAKTFVAGGLIFGLVPVTLSILGFIAATQVQAGAMSVADPQMVGPATIAAHLPRLALWAFTFMALAGLCSTLDSALCAASCLGSVDIYKRYMNRSASSETMLRAARSSMLIVALIGTSIALMQPKILWVFFTSGALSAAGFFPTILSLYWRRLPASGAVAAIAASLVLGTPLALYANIVEDAHLLVWSSLVSVFTGLVVCLIGGLSNREDFQFNLIALPAGATSGQHQLAKEPVASAR